MSSANLLRTTFHGLAVLVLAAGGLAAQAAPIIQHSGSADPTTEEFTFAGGGAGITTGPVTNDAGLDAWSVTDASANFGLYYQGFTPTERADLLANDFVATTTLRVVNASTSPAGALLFDVNLGLTKRRFLLYFGSNALGDLMINYNDTTITTYGGSGSGYHTIRLQYDADLANADVYLDNNLVRSDYTGISGSTQNSNANGQVQFGSGSGAGQGRGNYNLISVAVPEPASLVALGMGSLALLGRRRVA